MFACSGCAGEKLLRLDDVTGPPGEALLGRVFVVLLELLGLLTQGLTAFCEGEGHELAEALEVGHGRLTKLIGVAVVRISVNLSRFAVYSR